MKKMINILLIVIGIILLLWFLLPFFSNRILNIGNMTGIGVSLVLLLYGIFFKHVNHFIGWLWGRIPGRIICIVIGACIVAILVLAVMTMVCMGKGMTAQSAQSDADKTVIVLGCKVRGDQPSLMLEERLLAAYDYLVAHLGAKAIVSGGQGEDEIVPEADVMYDWLLAHGISEDRLLKEDRSTDTHENLRFSYQILAGSGDLDVVLVTNEFHEYRAVKIAKETGFQADPLPAKTAWWLFPTYYVREMYGILEDWFLQ